MDVPHHIGGNVPHWSRWERGATSFGPTGRVTATVLIIAMVGGSLFSRFFVASLGALLAAIALLRDIWKRDWIVPDERDLPTPPARISEPAPPQDPQTRTRTRTRTQTAYRYIGWASTAALGIAFAYGPIQAKAIALALGTLIGFAWYVLGFLSR